MDSRPSWVGDVDEPAVVVLQSNILSRMARRENQITEEVTKINQRVDRMIQTFERTPGIEMSTNSPDLEILEDMDELQNVLRDRNQKRKYQQKVTVFIVGYQETCGQRRHLLTQLQEFFSLYSKLSEEQEDVHPDVSGVDLDGVASQMTGALRSAETAISRLVDIHKEIMDSIGQRLSARAAGKRKPADDKTIKKLEKAVSQAKGDIMKLTEQLVQAQEDLSLKDQQMKELLKQHEMKVLEINYFKGQLEDTKANLQTLHNETATQRSRLDAELRKQASRLEELEIQVAGKGGLSKDTSTQWEVLNSTFDCEVGEFTEQIKEKKHELHVTDESPSQTENQFTEKAVQTDSIDERSVLSAHPLDNVDVSSCCDDSKPSVEEYEEDTPAQSEDPFVILGAEHTAVITLCPLRGERKCVITSVQASEDSKLLITSQTSSEMNLHLTASQTTNPDTFYSPMASHPKEDHGNSKNTEISLNNTMLPLTDNTTTVPAVSLKEPDNATLFILPEGQSDACLLHSDTAKVDDAAASNGNELHNNTLLARSLPPLVVNEGSSCLVTSLPVLNKNGIPIHVTDSISSQIDRDTNTDESLSDDTALLGDFSSDQHHVPDASLTRPDPKDLYIAPVSKTGINASVVSISLSDNGKDPAIEIDTQFAKPPPVRSVQTLQQGFTSLGLDEIPIRMSFESELGLKGQCQDPAPGEEKSVQTERPHHIEGTDCSGLNVVQTEESHNELRQVSQRLQRFIQEIQHLLKRSGYKSLAADMNVGVSSLNEDAISVNLTQLENIPAVLSCLLQWDGVTRHEKKKQHAGEFFQNDNNTTGPQGALQDRELPALSEPGTQRPLDVSIQSPITNKTNVFRTLKFSQHDEEHNKQILKRAAQHGRIPLHTYQDACRGMSQYRLLMQERLHSFVRGYMLYVSWDRAQVLLQRQRRHKPHVSNTLSNLYKTKQQSMVRWRQQRTRSQEERLGLLASLNQMFHGLQEESGIFLISPVQSWPRSSTMMETDRQTHFQRRPFLKSNGNLSSASKEQVRESLTCCGKTRSPAPKEWTFPHSLSEPRPFVITPKLLEMDVHRYLCSECCVMSQIYSPSTCFSLRSSTPLRSIHGVQRIPPFPAL